MNKQKINYTIHQKIKTLVSNKAILILISVSLLLMNSCSKSDSTGSGGGSTNSQYATLTCKIDGRTFTSTKGYGLYSEVNTGGTIVKSVSFGHTAATTDESISLQSGSQVIVGVTHTFSKGSSTSVQLDQALYKKPNSTSLSDAFLVSPLSSSTKCRFTYKVIRIFDNSASVNGKSVEFDFSGVLYKSNNVNDSVVITDGTLRY